MRQSKRLFFRTQISACHKTSKSIMMSHSKLIDHSKCKVTDLPWQENSTTTPSSSRQNTNDDVGSVQSAMVVIPFPSKLYHLLSDAKPCGFDHIIDWELDGKAFRIKEPELLIPIVQLYFNQTKVKSFLRQLQHYGFSRLTRGTYQDAIYRHQLFQRGSEELCTQMRRSTRSRSSGSLTTDAKKTKSSLGVSSSRQCKDMFRSSSAPFSSLNSAFLPVLKNSANAVFPGLAPHCGQKTEEEKHEFESGFVGGVFDLNRKTKLYFDPCKDLPPIDIDDIFKDLAPPQGLVEEDFFVGRRFFSI